MKKPTKRQGRVAEQIQQILSQLIQFEASDPRLAGVTVLDVEIDREFMYATIYVTAIDGEEVRTDVMQGLLSAGGFLRRELATRMSLRHVPELRFTWDDTAVQASHIDQLLNSLKDSVGPRHRLGAG